MLGVSSLHGYSVQSPLLVQIFRCPVAIQNPGFARAKLVLSEVERTLKNAKSGSFISLQPLRRRSGHALHVCAEIPSFGCGSGPFRYEEPEIFESEL
jgi:hypothetical protein